MVLTYQVTVLGVFGLIEEIQALQKEKADLLVKLDDTEFRLRQLKDLSYTTRMSKMLDDARETLKVIGVDGHTWEGRTARECLQRIGE